MSDSEVREKSEFNDALGYLKRINACLYAADLYSTSLDYNQWFHSLMAFYRELSTEIKPDQMEKFRAAIIGLNNEINRLNTANGRIKLSSETYFKLNDFELALRKIYKDSGLQMRMQSDASRALFNS